MKMPNNKGYFGEYGGRFVPETLMPLVLELERKLAEFLETDHFIYVSNGTIALQLAIKALELKGNIITTPFSYCATTTSLIWEHCNPVFADISIDSLTCESAQLLSVLNSESNGILTTHVYGNCGDLELQQNLALEYDIPLIYDGAHAFGVKYKGKSIGGCQYSDITVFSFHPVKIITTGEGGAILTNSKKIAEKFNIELLGQIPINIDLRIGSDKGLPFAENYKENKISNIFKSISEKIINKI
jgi:dTDP-4-amino-4,6-dideoxygalactose transaminase